MIKKAPLALGCGILALLSGLLGLTSSSDDFLLGVPVFGFLAIGLGAVSLYQIKRSQGGWRGTGYAGWGIGLPVGGFCLGFLLLPAT